MKIKLSILVLLLAAGTSFAVGGKNFNWTPPLEYEDGSALPQSEIASYDLECDGELLVNVPNVPLGVSSYKAPDGTFSVGSHSCVAFTVSIEGVRSAPSNTVTFTVAAGTPKPPVLVPWGGTIAP